MNFIVAILGVWILIVIAVILAATTGSALLLSGIRRERTAAGRSVRHLLAAAPPLAAGAFLCRERALALSIALCFVVAFVVIAFLSVAGWIRHRLGV